MVVNMFRSPLGPLDRLLFVTILCFFGFSKPLAAQPGNRDFAGLPPRGLALPSEIAEEVDQRLRELEIRVFTGPPSDRATTHWPDVACLLEAVRLAVEFDEFYREADFAVPAQLLTLAEQRVAELTVDKPTWCQARGLVVRGFRSNIDGSAQPYGLEIPAELPLDKPVPLYVWLHGRGDKTTTLHFIHERLEKRGTIHTDNAIVLHPFGRQCLGYKSAGETDVMEAIAHVQANYNIDPKRIVLMGFSMGGAGAWHLGAHFAERFVAVSPGAGFAETAQYNKLTPERYPPTYEQTLWGQYDVPNYVRNLFNLPVIAYSGENDPQMQAARVMAAAFETEGRTLNHKIGPGMGHRYHPETLQEIMGELHAAVQAGQDESPAEVHLQTRTLKYPSMHWVRIEGLQRHWDDSRVDAMRDEQGNISLTTRGVTALSLTPKTQPRTITVDGMNVALPAQLDSPITLRRSDNAWQVADFDANELRKRPGLQGPIDDAFTGPFLMITTDRPSGKQAIDAWVQNEVEYLQRRWRAVFRGHIRFKSADEVSPADLEQYHLLVWGTPTSNSLLQRMLPQLPLKWAEDEFEFNGQRYATADHMPVLIYPNPLNPNRYVVLNSGPTFRDAHDRTNSLQNPKLPDWAVLKVSADSTNQRQAGEVQAAGFFDESWQ